MPTLRVTATMSTNRQHYYHHKSQSSSGSPSLHLEAHELFTVLRQIYDDIVAELG